MGSKYISKAGYFFCCILFLGFIGCDSPLDLDTPRRQWIDLPEPQLIELSLNTAEFYFVARNIFQEVWGNIQFHTTPTLDTSGIVPILNLGFSATFDPLDSVRSEQINLYRVVLTAQNIPITAVHSPITSDTLQDLFVLVTLLERKGPSERYRQIEIEEEYSSISIDWSKENRSLTLRFILSRYHEQPHFAVHGYMTFEY